MPGKWQRSKNQDQAAISATSGTQTDNLSKANFLGEVILKVYASNGSTSNNGCATTAADAETVRKNVTKINLIANGGDIKNFDGWSCVAVAHFMRGVEPAYDETQWAYSNQTTYVLGKQYQEFPLLFMRYPGDEECVFPAKLFKTLQLKWTYSFTTSATVGYATNPLTYDLDELEYISNDLPTGKKILKETEIDTFTAGTSGEKVTPAAGLPLGNIIRRVFLKAYLAANDDGLGLTSVKAGINNFSETIINTRWENIEDQNKRDYRIPPYSKPVRIYTMDAGIYRSRVGRIKSAKICHYGAFTTTSVTWVGIALIAGDSITMARATSSSGTTGSAPVLVTTATNALLNIESASPVPYWVCVDFDPRQDLTGGIDTTNVNDVKVSVSQAIAYACVHVMQEVVAVTPAPG